VSTGKARGDFSDASLEWLHSVSVRVNRMMSPSDAVDLESLLDAVIATSICRCVLLIPPGVVWLEKCLAWKFPCFADSYRRCRWQRSRGWYRDRWHYLHSRMCLRRQRPPARHHTGPDRLSLCIRTSVLLRWRRRILCRFCSGIHIKIAIHLLMYSLSTTILLLSACFVVIVVCHVIDC